MATEGTVVHVWSGHFPDRATFDAYIKELPRDDLEEPLSEFISDQGHPWYDHDWFVACFVDAPSTDIVSLLKNGHAWASSYADNAVEEYRRLGLGPVNATFTLADDVPWKPRSVKRRTYRVDYIGFYPIEEQVVTE
jgi:Immunity protein 22